MPEYSRINFSHRKEISDYSDLVEMLFPGNRNQQHATVCILFELKWSDDLVSNLCYIENKYDISCRILQRTRAKLSRLGLIERISRFNRCYGGQFGWRLPARFEHALKQLVTESFNVCIPNASWIVWSGSPAPTGLQVNTAHKHRRNFNRNLSLTE